MKLYFIHILLLACYSSQQGEIQKVPIQCDRGDYRCADNSKCVQANELCNFKKNCNDFSDEHLSLCREFHGRRGSCKIPGQLYDSSYGCTNVSRICSDQYGYDDEFESLCNMIEYGLKPHEEFVAMTTEISTLREKVFVALQESSLKDVFGLLATSFNQSSIRNDSDCPPLYLNVDGKCMSLFTVAQVPWAEAKHFCESISGRLAILGNLTGYESLLEHLKSKDLIANFWIGGHYSYSNSQNSSGWKWLDEKDIALRAPYWSLYNAPTCTTRGNTRVCQPYSLAPRKNKDGFCLSLDYAHHYYFIDQDCYEKRSPLCVLDSF